MIHFIEQCEYGMVHAQCRCPNPSKTVRTVKCNRAEEHAPSGSLEMKVIAGASSGISPELTLLGSNVVLSYPHAEDLARSIDRLIRCSHRHNFGVFEESTPPQLLVSEGALHCLRVAGLMRM